MSKTQNMRAVALLSLPMLLLGLAAPLAKADTILNFTPCPGGTPSSACIASTGWDTVTNENNSPPAFGDNVSQNLDPNGYGYYGGSADTPNVTVQFDVESFLGWDYWGGAEAGLSFGSDTGHGYITLVADPGYEVTLDSFDYNVAGAEDYALQVWSDTPSSGSVLDDYSGSTTGSEALSFSPDVTGSEVSIYFSNWNTGLQNIDFSQVALSPTAAVSEPATIAIFSVGLLSLGLLRRKWS